MHHQPRARPADSCDKSRVAIIGTGLAGLTTAYLLHQDKQKRYEVTLFEQAPQFSLDAASVTLRNEATNGLERVDIPPRSFCRGYYANLCRMYDHLGVSFQRIQLIWVFAKVSAAAQAQIPSADAAQTMPGSYFVYGKRLHELLLVSPHFWLRGSLQNVLLTFYLAVCHAWFFAACFFFPPRMIHPERYLDVKGSAKSGQNCESFRQYLDRTWLPQYYVLYFLLPILSIICSCSHAEMLDFPASDVTSFMKGSFLRKTYVAKGGINRVQATLAEGIQDVRLQMRVNKVERVDGGVSIRYESTQDERCSAEEVFDRVVLAVSPNVAAAIFNPSKPLLSVIPTVPVTSTVLASPNTKISLVDETTHVPSGECSYRRGEAQIMAFRTTYADSIVQTESLHYLEGGLVVRTSPSGDVPEVKGTLDTSRFTRTLRTTESRNMVRKAMGAGDGVGWVNGKDHVWVVGSWCWDGMVLLEGCVVSAMRVARDLGVNVPW